MKKILCLLLTLVLSFGIVSCKKDKDGDNDGGNNNAQNQTNVVENVNNTINSSSPTQIVTTVRYTAPGQSELISSYVTERDAKENIEKFEFHIKRRAGIEEGIPGGIKELQGTVWKDAEGSVLNSEGDAWSAADAVGYLAESLTLRESYLKSYESSDNGNDITAYVTVANSERVFGASIAAQGDIKLEIDTNGTYLYKVTVTYTTASGATVSVVTSYDYAVINLEVND